MPKRTRDYHAWLLEQLVDPHEAERYLRVAMNDSQEAFLNALRNVAEARMGISHLAVEADVNRESLYRMLSAEGNPRYDTLESVLNALGMRLSVTLKQTRLNLPEPSVTWAETFAETPRIQACTAQVAPINSDAQFPSPGGASRTVNLVGSRALYTPNVSASIVGIPETEFGTGQQAVLRATVAAAQLQGRTGGFNNERQHQAA
jgi:probable addiction module antidote protein